MRRAPPACRIERGRSGNTYGSSASSGWRAKPRYSAGIGVSMRSMSWPPRTKTWTPAPIIICTRASINRARSSYDPQRSFQISGCCGTSVRTTPWHIEQVVRQPAELGRKPPHGSLRPIREGDNTNTVFRRREKLRVEARHGPVVSDDEVPTGVITYEAEAHPWQPRIRLVVGLEHGGERRRV